MWKNFEAPPATLTLIRQCPISNLSEIHVVLYTAKDSNFVFLGSLIFSYETHTSTLVCLQDTTIIIYISDKC